MFIREIKSRGRVYLHILESFRDGPKVKQRSIAALGCLDRLKKKDQLRKLANGLLKYVQDHRPTLEFGNTLEKDRKSWGPRVVIKKLWEIFRLNGLFEKLLSQTKIEFDFLAAVQLMVIDRLLNPRSKLACYLDQSYYQRHFDSSELQHLYRALDGLADWKEEIEEHLFRQNRNLFNMEVDVVLYDVTTLHFESTRANAMKNFGYSKDCKFNEVQVVLGLLVDQEGRPVGFDLFPGNTYEGKTLAQALKKMNERFGIKRVILVADSGMLSRDNLELIESMGYEFIVGGRVRSQGSKIKEQVLDKMGYRDETRDGELLFRYKELKLGEGDKFLVAWSPKRAKKDRQDRERLIRKAEKMLEKGEKPSLPRRGAMKYLCVESEILTGLNQAKIQADAKWDGYHALRTNCRDITGPGLLGCYHTLWKVEESFRILKSHFRARPIFHWTPRRIQGHLTLCFIAYLFERTLESELKKAAIAFSPKKIRDALKKLEYSEMEISGGTFCLRSQVEGLGKGILKALGIRIPPPFATREVFFNDQPAKNPRS